MEYLCAMPKPRLDNSNVIYETGMADEAQHSRAPSAPQLLSKQPAHPRTYRSQRSHTSLGGVRYYNISYCGMILLKIRYQYLRGVVPFTTGSSKKNSKPIHDLCRLRKSDGEW